jgi:methionine sulfoxide reductase heme-binding subunit
MDAPSKTSWKTWLLWLLLALPGLFMLLADAEPGKLLHPSGETSVRLMIVAMMIGPLADLLGQRGWLRWLLRHRRHFGVAAFAYAALHTLFYLSDMEWSLSDMLAEIDAPGIWTGWLALLIMLLPALASNDAAMRMLRRNWKRVQQLAYAAALLTLAHWILIEYEAPLGPSLVHFGPLILLNLARIAKQTIRRTAS